MRNISCMYTVDQIERRTKDVTRRLGWEKLQAGDLLRIIVKGQGLRRGEKIQGLAIVRVTDVRREKLRAMTDDMKYGFEECRREGFPPPGGKSFPSVFVDFFCRSHTGCTPETEVTRIEFKYIPGGRLR